MTRESKCVSLETAKLLKEAGVKQESESYWIINGDAKGNETDATLKDKKFYGGIWQKCQEEYYNNVYSAFDSDELLERLPAYPHNKDYHLVIDKFSKNIYYVGYLDKDAKQYYDNFSEDDSKLSEALAQLLLWCIKEGYVKMEEAK